MKREPIIQKIQDDLKFGSNPLAPNEVKSAPRGKRYILVQFDGDEVVAKLIDGFETDYKLVFPYPFGAPDQVIVDCIFAMQKAEWPEGVLIR